MTRDEAMTLRRGDFVRVLVPMRGGASTEDGGEEQLSYPAGCIASVCDLCTFAGPQGFAVTVAYGGVVNVFDEADADAYPLERMDRRDLVHTLKAAPFLADVIGRTLTDVENMVGGVEAYGYELSDEEHPWHETWAALKRAAWQAKP